jgi:MFS family permease
VVGGNTETVWLSAAIAIITCVLGPPVSQAADYWGRKWFIVILTLFGCVGCIIVSRATSMRMAIAGEVIAGLAYGAQPLLYAVASEILPRRYRPIAQAGINVSIGFGGIFGLLVGSTLVRNSPTGFRTFWYITAGILAATAVICAVLYKPPPRQLQVSLTFKEKTHKVLHSVSTALKHSYINMCRKQLDWVGYLLLASGIVLFNIALAWSQNPCKSWSPFAIVARDLTKNLKVSWKDAHVLAPFLVGIGLLIALAIHQTKLKRDGMFHHGLFS